ncbi:MAG TPA: FAD-binding oxidoreductase [Puia sp.]|nr:FAD-binding oxidoreductase [Puia sp.]
METIVKILNIEEITHDVRRYQLQKPAGYHFTPGQATDVSINQPRWKEELRPFTFTALNDAPYLEFTIKSYRDHDGVTNQLGKLVPGDELIVRDVWVRSDTRARDILLRVGQASRHLLPFCGNCTRKTSSRAIPCTFPTRQRPISSSARS